jgi:biotin operon repressor
MMAYENPVYVQRSRQDRLISLTTGGEISIQTVARIFECPEASVRRDIQELRREGYYIVLDQKQIKNYGLRQALIAEAEEVEAIDV